MLGPGDHEDDFEDSYDEDDFDSYFTEDELDEDYPYEDD